MSGPVKRFTQYASLLCTPENVSRFFTKGRIGGVFFVFCLHCVKIPRGEVLL